MKPLLSLALLAAMAAPALAGPISVLDPYARAASPSAQSGAAFMTIVNSGETADRLIAATSGAAQRVEIHTHIEDANGIMRMVEVEDGIALNASSEHALRRGGDHIMFMGLTQPFEQGAEITVILTFEQAGDLAVQIPVDNERRPEG